MTLVTMGLFLHEAQKLSRSSHVCSGDQNGGTGNVAVDFLFFNVGKGWTGSLV